MKISPSIASANQLRLEEEVRRVEKEGYLDLHIDIEDGNFIPNISFGFKTIKSLRNITDLPFSFHLMVTRPNIYIEDLIHLKPSIIFAHVEALDYILEYLHSVQKLGAKAGLAFNPKTPIEPYLYAIKKADGILIMTSEPDGKGQEFIPSMIKKAEIVRDYGNSLEIWADGGITKDKLKSLKNSGFTHIVMGREIFGQ